jgi:hypothetical protein
MLRALWWYAQPDAGGMLMVRLGSRALPANRRELGPNFQPGPWTRSQVWQRPPQANSKELADGRRRRAEHPPERTAALGQLCCQGYFFLAANPMAHKVVLPAILAGVGAYSLNEWRKNRAVSIPARSECQVNRSGLTQCEPTVLRRHATRKNERCALRTTQIPRYLLQICAIKKFTTWGCRKRY